VYILEYDYNKREENLKTYATSRERKILYARSANLTGKCRLPIICIVYYFSTNNVS
jgi:hypothetical protein